MYKISLSYLSLFIVVFIFSDKVSAECRIGLLLPVTGEYASASEECSYGVAVATERHAKQKLPIRFILEDSKAQGREAVNLFKKLVAVDNIQAIQLVRSPVGMAVNPLSKKAEIPVVGVVGHPEFIKQNPYAFQFWPSTADESKTLAIAINTDGNNSVYSLSTEDDWLLSFQESLNKNIQDLSGKIIASENVEPTFVDFRSLILKIKQSKADAVFIGFGPNQLSIFIKQFREAGMKQKLYATFNVKNQDVIKVLPKEFLEEITFVEIDVLKPIFMEKYSQLSNDKVPSAVSYSCYLSTEATYQACSQHLQTGKDFQDILLGMKSVETLDQMVSMEARQAKFEIATKKFKNGEILTIK